MKCPDCFSENYEISGNDSVIMLCQDCHAAYSIMWSQAFWVGFLKAEKKYEKRLTSIIERLEGEKINPKHYEMVIFHNTHNGAIDDAIAIVKEMEGG